MSSSTNDAISLPKKRYFRQRAHANVLGDHEIEYPRCPNDFNWKELYPSFISSKQGFKIYSDSDLLEQEPTEGKKVEVLDIGCGYGGLSIALAPLLPNTLILGMEIRNLVTEFVQKRILALRSQALLGLDFATPGDVEHDTTGSTKTALQVPGLFNNVACLRVNAMKFLSNYFEKGGMKRLFFLFPDPNFKKKKWKARIITSTLLSEYSYLLRRGESGPTCQVSTMKNPKGQDVTILKELEGRNGRIYTGTDVFSLHEWMIKHLDSHVHFKLIAKSEWKGVSSGEQFLVDYAKDGKVPEVLNENDPFHEAIKLLGDVGEAVLIHTIMESTEEGKKVSRNKGRKWWSVYERI